MFGTKVCIDNRKKLVKQQYLLEEKKKKGRRKKIETTWQKYNGLPYYIGRP